MTRRSVFLGSTLALLSVFALSCAPPKAYIDRTGEAQVLWPGPPDTPRIKYLWSVTQLSGGIEGRRTLYDFTLGDFSDDVSDPRTSNVLMRPYGISAGPRERLYVADPGAARVTVIDLKTSEVQNITEAGKDDLLSPTGVAADAAGRVYVADPVQNKVYVLSEKGGLLSTIAGFKRSTCLAVDGTRSVLFVSDTPDHRVYRYSTDGTRLSVIGQPGSGPGEFNYPTHLFVDTKGFLYVTDSMNSRIQIFDPEGAFAGSVGTLGDSAATLDKPKGVAVDSDGHIYVVDSIKDTVKVFDRDGSLLLFFGDKGHGLGQFWLPSGIFIDSSDHIYVADTYNMRVQVFQYLKDQGDKTGK